jgi:putative aldouronate transport system substrate-binding protein
MLNKNRKRWMGVILALTLVTSLFAGCAKDKDVDVSEVPGNETAGTVEATPEVNKEVSSPVKISMYVPSRLADKIYTKDTMSFKTLAEKCNMEFEIESVFSRQAGERFDVIISTGQLPDVMAGDKRDINTYGMSGAFLPLDDLINEYAPNIKNIW